MSAALDASLKGLMKQTLTVATPTTSTSLSLYGVKEFSTGASTYSCRYTAKNGSVRLDFDQSLSYTGIVWVASTGLTVQDKVTLPNGSNHAPVVRVDTLADEYGNTHHQVLYMGK